MYIIHTIRHLKEERKLYLDNINSMDIDEEKNKASKRMLYCYCEGNAEYQFLFLVRMKKAVTN